MPTPEAASSLDALDMFLYVCVYLGIIVSVASGLLGTLAKTRDEHDRLTHGGRVAVWVLIASLFITLAAQAIKDVKERHEASETSVRNRTILESLREQGNSTQRLLTQFAPEQVNADFSLSLPVDKEAFPELVVYLDGLKPTLEQFAGKSLAEQRRDPDLIGWETAAGAPRLVSVRIPEHSRYYPSGELRARIDDLAVRLLVLDKHVTVAQVDDPASLHSAGTPALNISLEGGTRALHVDVNGKRVQLVCDGAVGVEERRGATNAVVSIVDLASKQLILRPVTVLRPRSLDRGVPYTIASKSELRVERVGFGRYSLITRGHFTPQRTPAGLSISFAVFPSSIGEWFPGIPSPVHTTTK